MIYTTIISPLPMATLIKVNKFICKSVNLDKGFKLLMYLKITLVSLEIVVLGKMFLIL